MLEHPQTLILTSVCVLLSPLPQAEHKTRKLPLQGEPGTVAYSSSRLLAAQSHPPGRAPWLSNLLVSKLRFLPSHFSD